MKARRRRYRYWWLLGIGLVVACAGFLGASWYAQDSEVRQLQQRAAQLEQRVAARIEAIEQKKREPVYLTLPGADTVEVLREDYTSPASAWTLVNKDTAIPLEYAPDDLLVPGVAVAGSDRVVRSALNQPLIDMFGAAAAAGHHLMIGSAYRSSSYQATLFNGYVASVGLETASKYSARPGHSEHQLGLAVDINTVSQKCYLQECFTNTPDGQWLADNAHIYGFILRYPKGKEVITGYNFEPWHYRYVGVSLAAALHKSGLTLEEAWQYIEAARQTLIANRVFTAL